MLIAAGLLVLPTSCSAPRTRPVVAVDIDVTSVARTAWTLEETLFDGETPGTATPAPSEETQLKARLSLHEWLEHSTAIVALHDLHVRGGDESLLGDGPAQLDPDQGPVDLGYPLLVDLGAGDAPYDDGVATIHGEEFKRGGFSDSIIQMLWRERLSPAASIHTGAAIQRFQDLGILEGLSDARFAWAIVGLQWRF